jgi:glycosyltransferase involved in cell wall biosynthesis
MTERRPRVTVLYHYFPPDDVVSARHLGEFCQNLAAQGWQVEAWPSHRGCRDESVTYPLREDWQGVAVRRVWRPRFRQASSLGRLLNAAWMLVSWCSAAWSRRGAPDVLVIGTDPILSVLVGLVVKKRWPQVRLVHWCFDLYPEAAVAEGMLKADGWLVRALRPLLRAAYASCDLVADLGLCMREHLDHYGHGARRVTMVPWALDEPAEVERPDPATRRELFGDASLGLLYSGNFGRAHSYAEILELARRLQGAPLHFCFGVRGNRAEELRRAIDPQQANVSLAGFAPEAALGKRLAAADIHLVSLRPEWTGLVVPSKFFGALAAGRPVLFAGSRDAAIARWIREHGVGWVLEPDTLDSLVRQLRQLAASPAQLEALQRHCHQVYQREFSRRRVMDDWDQELRRLLPSRGTATAPRVSREPALPVRVI